MRPVGGCAKITKIIPFDSLKVNPHQERFLHTRKNVLMESMPAVVAAGDDMGAFGFLNKSKSDGVSPADASEPNHQV